MRAKFQVLIFPYRFKNKTIEFAIFRRSNTDIWQGISGGGENDESKFEAAKRESFEEAKIPKDLNYLLLNSMTMIPAKCFNFCWGKDVIVIPEYSFGVNINDHKIEISNEHKEYNWVSYKEAIKYLHWDSNKTAIWELFYRIHNGYI